MGSKLKERARKARSKGADDPVTGSDTPASTNGKAEAPKPKAEPKTTTPKAEAKASDVQASRPVDTASSPKADNVVSIADRAVNALSDDQAKAIVDQHTAPPEEPFTASLVATRETKAKQVQYDGKTPEGYIIRVWAPEDSPMLIGATLAEVSF